MANADVTIGPGVTIWPSVTEGPGVTTYNSVVSGTAPVPPDLLLMSTGIVLLMTTGSLQLV